MGDERVLCSSSNDFSVPDKMRVRETDKGEGYRASFDSSLIKMMVPLHAFLLLLLEATETLIKY